MDNTNSVAKTEAFHRRTPQEKLRLKQLGPKQQDITITRSFSRNWSEKKSWLTVCPETGALFCFTCLLCQLPGTERAWIQTVSVKRSQTPAAAPTSSKRAAAKQAPELGEEEEEEEEARPRKKRRKISDEEPAQSKADVPSVRTQSGPSRSEVSDESDNCTMEVEEEGNTTTRTSDTSKSEKEDKKSKPGPQTTKPEPAESAGSNSGSASAPAPSKPRLRAPCPYGKDCYRKNPIHFQECSHPGDTDYEEEDEETDKADRPECPYGTDCYRKNPLHRKEYKHTKKPARTTHTAATKVAPDDDEDDDSFINDDSEDVGNDSDYAPPDSGDSDKEDVRRLQKEAKEFLKRRK